MSNMICTHCSRTIVNDAGAWVDPEATGDDRLWRETCDAHDTFTAEHEPAAEHVNYPHEPGRLYDCAACDSRCYCTAGYVECVYEGVHNGTAVDSTGDVS